MSSRHPLPSAAPPQPGFASTQVQTLRDQFLALRSDYNILRVLFGHKDMINNFTEPDWFDLDDVAFTLHGDLKLRDQADVPVREYQMAAYQQLKASAHQIKSQLIVFRDHLEGPEAYEYPEHGATFQVLGPGNKSRVSATAPSSDFSTGRQKFARSDNPARRGAETAVSNLIMSGALPACGSKVRKASGIQSKDQPDVQPKAKKARIVDPEKPKITLKFRVPVSARSNTIVDEPKR